MDPTANLEGQLRLANKIRACTDAQHEGDCQCPDNADELSDLVIAMDRWLRNGGFFPRPWLLSAQKGGC